MKYFIVFISLVFLPYYLLAEELKKETYPPFDMDAKSRIHIEDGVTSRGIIYLNVRDVFGQNFHKHERANNHYLRNIKAMVGEQNVLDVYFSSLVYTGGLGVKFKFKDFAPYHEKIEYTMTDNHGQRVKKTSSIKRIGKVKESMVMKDDLIEKIDPQIWKSTSMEDILKRLYGTEGLTLFQLLNKNYNMKRECANLSYRDNEDVFYYDYYGISIKIDSNESLKSVAIFNIGDKFPLRALYKIHVQAIAYIQRSYQFRNEGNLVIMAEDRDKNFYTSKPICISRYPTSSTVDSPISKITVKFKEIYNNKKQYTKE